MKFKLLKSILPLFLLLFFSSSFGAGIKIGDLYYNLDSETKTAEVTYSTTNSPTPAENNYPGLTAATIPSTVEYNGISYSVTSIGQQAFDSCVDLTSVTIPNSVITIGVGAFEYCSSLTSVEIPNSVTSIEDYAFCLCGSLKSVEIPNSVISIGRQAFVVCVDLTSVTIPNSVTSIGDEAFRDCSSLTSVTIPNSVTSIGSSAFEDCRSLTSVIIPNSVTSIGDYAFWGCSSLVKSAYPNTFRNPFSDGITIAYPKEAEFSEDGIIYDSGKKTLLFVPLDFKNENCIIPNSVTSIGKYAFYACKGLTNLTIPASVTSIGDDAFSACPIETLQIDCAHIDNWFNNSASLKNLTLGNSVTTIGVAAFEHCSLTSVEIPNSVTSIGNSAFYGCSDLTNLTIGNSVTSIGNSAFSNCNNLSSLEIPNSVTTIGDYAFYNCGFTYLELPKSLKSIGLNAFTGNPIEKLVVNSGASIDGAFSVTALQEVIFGDDAVTIPSFAGASLLTDVTLPTPLESIPAGAFSYCSSLQALELPAGLTSVGSGAFSGCSSLEEIVLPAGVTSIPESMFENCTSLEKVKYSDKVASFGANAFFNCPSLRSVTIPNGVTEIPNYFLASASSITEIRLPNTVQTIGYRAFADCKALMNVVLGTGIYSISDYAFDGCENIADLYCLAQNPPYAERYSFPIKSYTSTALYVQEQSLSKYSIQDPWMRFTRVNTLNEGIQLSHYDVSMAGNQVFQLGVYGSDSKVTWSASNPEVAYANECGLVVGRGITGSSIITATVDGVSVDCRVNIVSPRQPKNTRAAQDDEADIEPVDIIIESIGGNPPMVNVRLIPVGSKTVIDWSTSDSDIATVEDGLVTFIREGDVDIKTETGNGLDDNYNANVDEVTEAGLEIIISDNDFVSNDIFNLQGVCVKRNASKEDIDTLAPGIYIFGGKKVVVK